MNASVYNISGITNGVTYTIGVRAYNPTEIYTNINIITVTAGGVGPGAVEMLTSTAVA
jgi:hypothetical protein